VLNKQFYIEKNKVIIHSQGSICATANELVHSPIFEKVVNNYCDHLQQQNSPLIEPFVSFYEQDGNWDRTIDLLRSLIEHTFEEIVEMQPDLKFLLDIENRLVFHEFVEKLYDYWRSFDRFVILHSEPGKSRFEKRPYRSFNITLEKLTHIVRAAYRDICENITGNHPRIYRQIFAGCDVGLIAVGKNTRIPEEYHNILREIPFIRQAWIAPPMIIDPPMNKRTGEFQKVDKNPLSILTFDKNKWLCYPAQVGSVVIFIYFHHFFMELGCAMANLFELATDEQIENGPEAIYFFGAEPETMKQYGDLPTVFYDDEQNNLLIAAVPAEDRFGYFGYLKKMTLTLHNIVMIKRGRMPFHGAMFKIGLKNGNNANIVIIGDTATGKSESIEAFRILAKDYIKEFRIIADDMGSFEISNDGKVLGYGTEVGAFIRLDDLQQGYAFEQIDRAVIMSPQKINARVVLPVTTLHDILCGYPVNYILYANNYEEVDDLHPVLEKFDTSARALDVFREGAAMAKGTTTSIGLVHSYFANIFGPPQYKQPHEKLAQQVFDAVFKAGIFVGQLRTRLGIAGYESKGAQAAAAALIEFVLNIKSEKTGFSG